MTSPGSDSRRAVRFLHLGDLHLSPSCEHGGACGPKDPPCHQCIKTGILRRLQVRLVSARTRPDLLLLAGDLTDMCETVNDLRLAAAPLDEFVNTALAARIVVAGIVGEHDWERADLRRLLGWSWLLRTGGVVRASGVAVYGVNGRSKQERLARDIGRLRPKEGEPSVLLAHGSQIPSEPRFNYYALGHLHWSKYGTFPKGSMSTAAYPGHLFSYWDGSGKAWPVYVLEGRIHADGHVDVERVPLSGAPETRRIYISSRYRGRERGVLFFENPPEEGRLRRLGVRATFKDEPDKSFGTVYRRVARASYGSQSELRGLLRKIVGEHPNDIFVSPATGRGNADRVVAYGHTLLGKRFEEFVSKTYKSHARTQ
jgi:hypothetical protein